MMKHKFLATILTHRRPDTVLTYNTLRRCGYTGKILLILDNEDPTLDEYKALYAPDEIYVFDKAEADRTTDNCDNKKHRKTALYARNAVFDIAQKLGFRYFIQLDDDYTVFRYRMLKDARYGSASIKNLDNVFDLLLDFYAMSKAHSIAMTLGGDHIGGDKNTWIKDAWRVKRKCMASWICDTKNPLKFAGHMNDDCSRYTVGGRRGELYMQFYNLMVNTVQTQSTEGGMTDVYKDIGTYVKTMYTVIQAPSCTNLRIIGHTNPRIHHQINWPACAVKIIREEFKKS